MAPVKYNILVEISDTPEVRNAINDEMNKTRGSNQHCTPLHNNMITGVFVFIIFRPVGKY